MIMRNLLLLIIIFSILAACDSEDGKKRGKRNKEQVLESYANGTARKVWEYKEIEGKQVAVTSNEYYEDGKLLKTGPLKDGRAEGEWFMYYRSGKIMNKGLYKNGKRNDTTIAYYENGKIKYIGIFNEGEKTGKWQLFTEEGELEKIQAYLQPGEVLSDSLSLQ